eukprot:4765918-Lingulodinium_polyedra.AAC.1
MWTRAPRSADEHGRRGLLDATAWATRPPTVWRRRQPRPARFEEPLVRSVNIFYWTLMPSSESWR